MVEFGDQGDRQLGESGDQSQITQNGVGQLEELLFCCKDKNKPLKGFQGVCDCGKTPFGCCVENGFWKRMKAGRPV